MNLPPRFLNWRMESDPLTGKDRKVPCLPDGTKCDSHDPKNHTTFEVASAAPYGVAFDIRKEDGLFFLDLDKCRLPDGQWRDDAVAIFTAFAGAWGEVSQSDTGLHIIGRCDPSRLTDRRNKWDGWLEFYTDQRFVAFGRTGWAPIGGIAAERDFTDLLLKVVPQRENLGDLPEGIDPRFTGPVDDEALLALMLKSGGAGAAFGMKASAADLWNADTAKLARLYPAFDGSGGFDHSSADAALMAHLAFWTGRDMPRMDRLFRRSALMREKYEQRADYRRDTVQNAARLCRNVYDRPAPVMTTATAALSGASEVYLTVAEMHEHFAGCVYIRDMHRVLIPDGSLLKPEQFNASFGGHSFQMLPDGTKPTDDAFKALTQNKATRFPQAIRPCFRPDLAPGTILEDGSVNTYVDPNVLMTEGDVTPFMDLLTKLLPVERDRQILLAYMAAVVQHPGVKFQWAPVLQGTEGNGKTAIFSCVAYAVGRRYAYSVNPRHIGSQFNAWVEGKVFCSVEEIDMGGKREALDILKPLITNVETEIEGKGQDKRAGENRANFAFCTNYKNAVIKSHNDRRYAIFFTAQQSADDLVRDGMSGSYFPDFYAWLRKGGGYAKVAYFLKHYAIPADLDPSGSCHRAPITSSTSESITESLGGIEQEIVEAAQDNTQGFRGGWVSSWALDKLCRDRGIRIGRNKYKSMLESLGYVPAGRPMYPIFEEDKKRPVLFKLPTVTADNPNQDYQLAQHYVLPVNPLNA
jgi:hypothetical protein